MELKEFANLLIDKGYEGLGADAWDLYELRCEQNDSFNKWYKEHRGVAGHDDSCDNELAWIGKAINFFIEKGYVN